MREGTQMGRAAETVQGRAAETVQEGMQPSVVKPGPTVPMERPHTTLL